MANPLFQQMGNPNVQQPDLMRMLQQFQQFKTQFQGDPRQMVQQILSSGKMSQEQYNQLAQMANQLYPKFK